MRVVKKKLAVAVMSTALSVASIMPSLVSANTVEERPTATEMAADALMRPVMVVGVLLGVGTYLVSLPLSLAGGNAKEAGQVLVVNPAKATFTRCLGCTKKHEPHKDYY